MSEPVMLTIAGSDPSGGAGIQADLKTATALGVYGASVLTALTAQNTHGVQGVHPVPTAFVAAQLDSVLSDLSVSAVKIGMLGSPELVATVAAALSGLDVPIVLDPVLVATSGDRLVPDEAVVSILDLLVPLSTVVTPNAPEATVLTGVPVVDGTSQENAGRELVARGAASALVKGGHLGGGRVRDALVTASTATTFVNERVRTRNSHGTGCTLSAAIAARLALGETLPGAVETSIHFVHRALVSGAERVVGSGNGPVDHLADLR